MIVDFEEEEEEEEMMFYLCPSHGPPKWKKTGEIKRNINEHKIYFSKYSKMSREGLEVPQFFRINLNITFQ